jgi:uncharacterized protein
MIRTLVIKAVRACNLRCPYCYYINEKTENYGTMMTLECARRLYLALGEYARIRRIVPSLIWHGGEPLLLGKRKFQALLDAQSEYFPAKGVVNCLQTNGVLIDESWLDFFQKNDIKVGISLDGPPEVHDRWRPKVGGGGSHAETARAIELLHRRRIPFGVIAVAGPQTDGAAVIRHFREIGVPSCDLLLPITNHALQRTLPTFGDSSAVDIGGLSRYLVSAFHEWVDSDEASLSIRLFEALIRNALGIRQGFANAGPSEEDLSHVVVVETNGELCMDTEFGEIERNGFGNEYRLDCSVFDGEFSFETAEARLHDRVHSRRLGNLPGDCQQCPVRSLCRGSHPGSRFDDRDQSFDHRSAYCKAMYALCSEVVDYLHQHGLGANLADPELRSLVAV